MKLKHIVPMMLALSPSAVMAQKASKPVVVINNEVATYGEFMHMFEQNMQSAILPATKAEYLQLFIDYKLKVAEAIATGKDTTTEYKRECAYYISELNKTYLEDSTAEERMKKMLRQRTMQDIHAAHILVNIKPNATPADTAEAYARISELRDRIVKNGENFTTLAKEFSEDPSAKSNGGDLGYFSTMQMVDEFEDAAYATAVGETSPIIRTQFGYHILHVMDKRPFEGEVLLQHVVLFERPDMSDNEKEALALRADSLYRLLADNVDLPTIAMRFSDDKRSAYNGGYLPMWMSKPQLIQIGLAEYADVAFNLKKGQVSIPFKTQHGWHILKVADRRAEKSAEEFNQMFNQMKSYSDKIKNYPFAERMETLAKEYKFAWAPGVTSKIVEIMTTSTSHEEHDTKLKELTAIGTMNKKPISTADLLEVIDKWNVHKTPATNLANLRNNLVAAYELSVLPKKYPEYSYTKKEYTDGLLVFEIGNGRVWNVTPDSLTEIEMYEQNKARYSTGGAFEGTIYFAKTKKDVAKIKILIAQGKKEQAGKLAERTVEGPIQQGDIYDDILWPNIPSNDYIVVDGTITNGEPIGVEAAHGIIVSDYQQKQDAKLIEELRTKYNPKIKMKLE